MSEVFWYSGIGSSEKSSKRITGGGGTEGGASQVNHFLVLIRFALSLEVDWSLFFLFRGETVTVGQHRRLELRLREFERWAMSILLCSLEMGYLQILSCFSMFSHWITAVSWSLRGRVKVGWRPKLLGWGRWWRGRARRPRGWGPGRRPPVRRPRKPPSSGERWANKVLNCFKVTFGAHRRERRWALHRAEKQRPRRRGLSWRNNWRFNLFPNFTLVDEESCGLWIDERWFDSWFKVSEVEVLSARNELKLAVRRAEDLQVTDSQLARHLLTCAGCYSWGDGQRDGLGWHSWGEWGWGPASPASRRQDAKQVQVKAQLWLTWIFSLSIKKNCRSGHSLFTEPSNVSTVSSIEERDESEAWWEKGWE